MTHDEIKKLVDEARGRIGYDKEHFNNVHDFVVVQLCNAIEVLMKDVSKLKAAKADNYEKLYALIEKWCQAGNVDNTDQFWDEVEKFEETQTLKGVGVDV